MSKDDIGCFAGLSYVAVALVVFGFFVKTFVAKGPVALIFGIVVAGLWPASALIWLGAWLA
ncbi:hypothetical protein [Rhizobium sp.]|uniref:hypothetical protein n=1 Tax=Rhizobium sp. TaxID=391 RepID=UPI00289BF618